MMMIMMMMMSMTCIEFLLASAARNQNNCRGGDTI